MFSLQNKPFLIFTTHNHKFVRLFEVKNRFYLLFLKISNKNKAASDLVWRMQLIRIWNLNFENRVCGVKFLTFIIKAVTKVKYNWCLICGGIFIFRKTGFNRIIKGYWYTHHICISFSYSNETEHACHIKNQRHTLWWNTEIFYTNDKKRELQ